MLIVAGLPAGRAVGGRGLRPQPAPQHGHLRGTVAPLAKDPAVQTAVATRVSQNLVARADIEDRVKNALPVAGRVPGRPHLVGRADGDLPDHPPAGPELPVPEVVGAGVAQVPRPARQRAAGKKVGAFRPPTGRSPSTCERSRTRPSSSCRPTGSSVFDKVPDYTGAPFVLFQSDQLAKLQRWVRFLQQPGPGAAHRLGPAVRPGRPPGPGPEEGPGPRHGGPGRLDGRAAGRRQHRSRPVPGVPRPGAVQAGDDRRHRHGRRLAPGQHPGRS